MGRTTSASNRKVAVSDQFRAEAVIIWPPCERWSASIFVKGQGPAIHEARALRNAYPGPASKVADPRAAFHLPSGEQRDSPLQGTLPLFSTSKVLTALPTFSSVMALSVCLTRTLATLTSG